MSDINPLNPSLAQAGLSAYSALSGSGKADRATVASETSAPARRADALDLSPAAQTRAKAEAQPVRQDLVDRIRDEIDAGTYETPSKINVAVDRLLSDLG